jgi:hypothetical protein
MSRFNLYQTGTSALLALSVMAGAAVPLVAPGAASAQPLFRGSTESTRYRTDGFTIPYGTNIPVYYDQADKIVVAPDETMPLTLKVASNIRNSRGTLLIPQDSEIVGELRPVDGGAEFVARELIIDGDRVPIDATSDVITETQEVGGGTDTGSILKGAALGAGAAAAIQAITGDHRIGIGTTLGGGGLGALGGLLLGGHKKTRVVVIDPNSDLNLTLRSSLALR